MEIITFKSGVLNHVMYWGLPDPIWNVPHTSYELTRRTDSISGALLSD